MSSSSSSLSSLQIQHQFHLAVPSLYVIFTFSQVSCQAKICNLLNSIYHCDLDSNGDDDDDVDDDVNDDDDEEEKEEKKEDKEEKEETEGDEMF